MIQYQSTPVLELYHSAFEQAQIRVLVKREDLNHPFISGNKWWKLRYNIADALEKKFDTILTFGGAYSNHIFATAAAASECGLKSIGVIRGERTLPLNPTLTFAERCGMTLHFVSREIYRDKTSEEFISKLKDIYGDFFPIPEGGTNELALKGCSEFAERELSKIEFDYLMLPVGTGGTISGIICGLKNNATVIGVSVLKNGTFLSDDISRLTTDFTKRSFEGWKILTEYHHGGYAKTTDALNRFIAEMKQNLNLPLDHVYTGKMMWALVREAEAGNFKNGSVVLALHTGGLQSKNALIKST